jgi:hypothetical protein
MGSPKSNTGRLKINESSRMALSGWPFFKIFGAWDLNQGAIDVDGKSALCNVY